MAKNLEIVDSKSVKLSALAAIIVRITNPCALSIFILMAILLTNANYNTALLKWIITLIVFLILLPLTYVYLRIFSERNKNNHHIGPAFFLKRHPTDILILEVVCGVPCWAILRFLNAPSFALLTMVNLLIIAFIIAVVNLFYYASFHLATIVLLIYMTVIIWGPLFVLLILAVPLIAWAKYKLHDHNLFQMVTGVTLAIIVGSITFFLIH